jgi:hypothetical protein
MRVLLIITILGLFLWSCSTTKKSETSFSDKEQLAFNAKENDTVKIANDSLEYQIIILEPGFNFWLNSIARPKGYYDKNFLENRNRLLVLEWNNRVQQPQLFDPNIYLLPIDYNYNIDYGYDVNYKLYNFFIYFQRKYKQRLTGFVPRI